MTPSFTLVVAHFFMGPTMHLDQKYWAVTRAKVKKYSWRPSSVFPTILFLRVMYVQTYLIPQMDEEGFVKEMEVIKKLLNNPHKKAPWVQNSAHPRVNLMNATAEKRWQIINKYRGQILE